MTLPEQLERLARDLPALEYGRNAWGAIRCRFPGPVGVDAAEHVVTCIENMRNENAKLREDKARLDWLNDDPYVRLQKVREWLPISTVPPGPDYLRAAIDNAKKHDPNYCP